MSVDATFVLPIAKTDLNTVAKGPSFVLKMYYC